MAVVIKFALLSLAVLLLLLPCQPLEVPNYQGAEDWPELTMAARRHQRIIEEDRTGFNMRRLGGPVTEPEPIPITKPESEPEPITEPQSQTRTCPLCEGRLPLPSGFSNRSVRPYPLRLRWRGVES
ncbi:hypothetical protein ACJRO7_015255 [Eucalyptus globulus]|uniref:Uncharacterized protein n=1 Tax=Eucalyptus globulus TaxID=34317 RepID=A0ABD3L2Z6_EUCGL